MGNFEEDRDGATIEPLAFAQVSVPLVYVDCSDVHDGALPDLRAAIEELARFIEANEPQLLAYSVYFSQDGKEMSVVHVHHDAASLDFHMDVAGPRFAPFADLLTLRSITVYGTPSSKAVAQLEEKARLLGGDVRVEPAHAGFARVAGVGR
jgi:hypothetical protein